MSPWPMYCAMNLVVGVVGSLRAEIGDFGQAFILDMFDIVNEFISFCKPTWLV